MEVQAGPNLCTWILIFTIGFGAGYVNSEYSKDDEVWGRLPLQLINGRYEKLLVAIHETVDQDDDIIPNIMKALTSASRNMFEATKREIGVSLGEVLIAVPTHWDMPTLTGGNEGLNERVAEWYELYDKSHVRIRNYQILEDIKSFQQGEPYVLQPGSCGEEGVFIGLEPSALDANISCWGDINKTFVHLWGHFRWGLFDEYVQTEYGVAELCTAGIIFEDVMISGDSRAEVPSTNSCLRKERFYYKAKNTENTTASIMSISDADQIVDFCDSNKSDIRSLHNQDTNNRHNKMCNKLSSWEIMRRHTDFANGSRQANDTIPRFTILLPRRKAIFMEDSNTCINDSNNTLDVKQRNECYLLRSTISVTTSQKIHLFHNSTSYCVYDHRRGAMGECFDYTSVDMNNDVLVFESGLSMYKNSLTSNVSSSKPILIAKEIEEGWQHEYKSTAEYITSINYDDVESNIRVEVNEFTITADTHYPCPLQLDRLLGNGKILCRIQWDSGNISIPDCEYEECFISDKLIEIRYEKFDVTNNVTIRNTDIFSITVRVELFFISDVNNALPPVVVKPFIKKYFTGSGWKIYASVTYLSKPVYNLSVNARIRGPDGSSHELLLSDIPEESDDMMDGIYSNVIDVNGSGWYSVQVTVKGANNITWNMENLHPSGVVPSECDVPLNPLNAALENADSLMRMPKELNFYVTDVTPPTAICQENITTDARLQEGTAARVDFVASCSDNIDTGIQAACNATSQTEFPVGVTTVTCSCEDLSQNTDECSFTVTVKDVTEPTASCPNDIDTDARLHEGTTARADFVALCSDNIDTGIQAACNATNQTEFPVGVTTVTCSCEDLSQNTDECSFTVTVKDVTEPTASCPNDIDTDARLHEGTTARADFVALCSDNIDTGIQAACNATNQTEFPVGVTTVTCSCEDLSQNTDECSFTVTVKDVTEPTASCPNDIDTDARLHEGTTARADFVALCSDNIDTGIQAACYATNQTEFPVGVTTVTCSCEDLSQNTDECSFTVTVKDVTEPTASCPNDIDTDARLHEGTTARADFVALCSDNIDTGIQAACNATNQTEFPVGVTTVTCSCEDLSQNTDECSFTVTVKDVTDPTASCPNDTDTDARLHEGTTARVDFVASCSDNIDTGIQAACNATNQTEFPVGVTTVTCSCEDLSQNTDECSFTVTVKDVTPPTAICQENITTNARLQEGTTARVNFVTSCSDNIDTGIQAACNATSQSEFPVGVTTVTCSCEDLSQNTDECSFTVTVKDVTPPTAICQENITTDARLQEGTTARVNFVTSCSDNIDTGIQAACNATSGSEFPVGVTTVTCSCEDLSQNTDECSFTVTVKDVTDPTASCPNDTDTDARLQEGTAARVDFVASCSDNIDTGIQAACNATSGSEFPVGVTTVTCSCEDLSQNTDECSFTVTVKDVTPPTAICQENIKTDARLQVGTTARVNFVTSCSDNIDTGIQAACNATSGSEFPVGVTTVTCSCEDLSQNTDDCSFTVTVKDVTHPTASCPSDIDTDAMLQEGTTARVDFVTSCSDNIDTSIQADCNATSGSEFPVGVTTVTCSCEDLSQNTDRCSFTVTVKDVTHPMASCPNDIDTDARLQEGTTARVDFVTSCSDNIDTSIQADCNATSGSDFPFGVTIVNCSCQDISQNTDECSFNVIVKEAVTSTGNESSSTADTKSITTESLTTEASGHQTTEAVTATGNNRVSTVDTKSMTTESLTTEVSFHQTTGNDNSSTADTKSIIDTESMTTGSITTVVAAQKTTEAVTSTGNESSSTVNTNSMTTKGLTTEESGHQTTGVPKVTFTTEVPILSTMKPKENQIPVIILPVSIAIASFAVLSILLRFIEDTFRRSGSNKNKDPETPPDSPTSQGPKKINGTALRELY
ncbi:uncharacterized protein [Apostichopus japonicus]|uniref:uncharacterized protein isoform X4 n=1 Tax=Stichopus japonicus TaxID=307972 RepID=UPI003AB5714D